MKTTFSSFDVAEHLETDEDIQGFLKEVSATGDIADLVHALNTVARAKGMTHVAEQAGVSRASLYKSLAEDGNPHLKTISKVAEVFGCKLLLS
jgi:probable addiction module antidote protein